MSKVQVDTIDTRSGTSTMQIGSTNTSTINIGVSGDTVNIPSGVTIANAGTATGFGQDNTPAFHAYANNSYTAISNDTYTAIPCPNELFDSNSAYNTSNYRFTPQTAGKYFCYANVVWDGNLNVDTYILLQKNGSFNVPDFLRNANYATDSSGIHVSGILTFNGSSDYLEARIYHQQGGNVNIRNQGSENYFGAFLVTTT